jgi:hypothetical protein
MTVLRGHFAEICNDNEAIYMRHLILIFCMTIATVLMTATATIALPACPSDPTKRYHNCFGTLTFAGGDKYVGEHKDGKPDGKGIYSFPNGSKYIGEFKDGRHHGQGAYSFADGKRYVGAFKDGDLNGYAIQYRADGSILREGIFKNGEFQRAQN